MNLSKTEKLLAAKKRLKEFQLQKKLQAQEASNKPQNTDVASETISQCQTSYQSIDTDKSCNQYNQNKAKNTENFLHSEKHKDDVNAIHTEESAFNDTNNLIDITGKTATNNSQTTENSILENFPGENISYESSDKDATHLCLQPDVQFTENNGKYNLNITPSNGPSTVQKEHLLEMASEVANVLTDGTDNSELTGNLDAKCRYQFVNAYIEEQKQLVNDLHIQVSRHQSKVAELGEILATKDSEFEARLIREINPLKEQLQVHAQTTGILIAEKAELTAALAQSQKTAKQNSEELEEMNGKLKHSQLRTNELEKELVQMKSNSNDTQKNAQQIQQIYDELEKKYYELRKEKEDMELETSELKQKLNLKNTEFISLQQEFQEKAALLSLNELRIQQLTDTSQTLESQHQAVTVLEQQLTQMRETLKLVNNEKDETNRQYQNYVRQLDTQQAKLLNELESERKLINDFENREKSYVQRLSDLEQQLQHEKEKNEALLPLRERNDDVNSLMKNIEGLTAQQEKLHAVLSEKDSQIEMVTKEVQQLRDAKGDAADAAKLVQALESEKLGASRAVLQNQQLKQQLTEMENAFVTLSNTKLDLTEQLQAERSIGRKLNAKLNTVETEVDNLKEKLKEKEKCVMKLEKERFKNTEARERYLYRAQSNHAKILQQELRNSWMRIAELKKETEETIQMRIAELKKESEELTKKLETKAQEEQEETALSKVNVNGDQHMTKMVENGDDVITTQNLSLPENKNTSDDSGPITKLEDKFKEAMEKVAELTDEKQRLEHLVLQLQGETETIGEYITLYQKQREVLRNKWKEREETFRQLVEQCNQQQEQLHKLKILVTDLLKKHPTESCIQLHKDINVINPVIPNDDIDDEQETAEPQLIEDKTTSQILDLLTEIKDCKDICITEPNFHPCPWCSGKLITV
ncbi:PREDICTED: golgin subfamily A member 2-like [Dinoponera quadriceps]|uniref:Golgin subfamily A member 2-like n=1 Tax=Dinoponera quadriceps TaxID=609295 RepID=A0A6P3WQJ9_DINQU|nr:PREDICTED: golgin subfamily A member 2-like [Dinoponera quadriceps]